MGLNAGRADEKGRRTGADRSEENNGTGMNLFRIRSHLTDI
jgi:hypothetical protein